LLLPALRVPLPVVDADAGTLADARLEAGATVVQA
jgi:hypothetical protein